MAPLPANTETLERVRKSPADIELLADTSSSVHVEDAEIQFPRHVSHVQPPSISNRVYSAKTAGGHKLANLGKLTVKAKADGHQIQSPLNHMKMTLPPLFQEDAWQRQ